MIAKLHEVILEDRRQTIRDVCNPIGLSYGSCQRILADELNMRRNATKLVPHLLNNDQWDHLVQVYTELQRAVRCDRNFLAVQLWPGNKAAVFTTEDAILSATEKRAPSSQQPHLNTDFFFDIRGILHKEFVPPGQTDNGNFYCDWGKVRHKWPEMWKNGDWLLHHDNAPAHTWLIVREFLTNSNMTTVPHPAYSPDLAPCDFFVFTKMKLQLKERHFVSIEEIQAVSQQVLNTLTPADFIRCFQKWQNCWDHCTQAQGDYFEGDGGN